jgi:SAM-dependent methyltransferase
MAILGGTHIRHQVRAVPSPPGAVASFAHWVAEECPDDARVLNIGAGCNLSGSLTSVRRRAGLLVGVDPDPAISDNPTLDERHCQSMEEYAATGPAPFDLAFSVFVLEHVHDPDAFTQACARVLRPGGVLMGMTVNMWHYFGLATWAATRAGVADRLLPHLRPRAQVDNYHFATEYRLNTIRAMMRHLEDSGFDAVEFRCWDLPSMYEPYLPGPVRGVAGLYHKAVYRIGSPYLMGHITFRATLGSPDSGDAG